MSENETKGKEAENETEGNVFILNEAKHGERGSKENPYDSMAELFADHGSEDGVLYKSITITCKST
jgi:hypothetical protein